jgi:hypothetical protein
MLKDTFPIERYRIVTHSISFLKANIVALITPLPFVLLYLGIYLVTTKYVNPIPVTFSLSVSIFYLPIYFFLYFLILFLLVVLHELIHAVFFLPACVKKWKSIHFGIKSMTPYCHCKEIMTLSQYRRSLWGPLWILVPLLVAVSLLLQESFSFLFTMIMIFGSGGDLYVFWITRKYHGKTTYVWDMVDQIGCEIYLQSD